MATVSNKNKTPKTAARKAKPTSKSTPVRAAKNKTKPAKKAAPAKKAKPSKPPKRAQATAPSPKQRISPEAEVEKIRASAERLGIELDQDEALQWLTQMAVQDANEVTVDTKHSIYGAKVAILDFSPQDLEYFRAIGKIVAVPDQPGVVETALALSGSAAQSKIQKNPGDADYFQRVNIQAATRQAAIKILADLMRAKGLDTRNGPNYHLLAVKFGTHTQNATRNGKALKKGSSMTWYPPDLEAGAFEIELADGSKQTIQWADGMVEPGWTNSIGLWRIPRAARWQTQAICSM